MSSDRPVTTTASARALASRRNGAKSRGPKTAAGKARSARNALKHGLCSKTLLVLAEEDAAQFRALEAALLAELAPVGVLQAVLAQRVVSAAWRLMRADRMEAEVLDFRRLDDGGGLGLALIRDGNGTRGVETVMRYRNAAMAELLRAQKTLHALQAEARADARAAAGASAGPDPRPAAAHARAAAGKPARRRARPRVARPIEPEKPRQIKGSAENRALDGGPAGAAPKTGTQKPAADHRSLRRSPDLDVPAAATAPASPLAGAERTQESAPNQSLDPRARAA
jgi:hypothetical protein